MKKIEYTNSRKQGFTIVELIIVIVVIGILAAITIVAYRGIQNRARTASAQSALVQASEKVAAYAVTNGDQYPSALSDVGIGDSGGVSYQYSVNNNASPRTYCITATNGTQSYFQNNTTQPTPKAGGCPGHGQGGVAAITNYHLDPGAHNGNYAVGFSKYDGSGNAGAVTNVAAPWSASGNAYRMTWSSVGSPNSGDLSTKLFGAAGQKYTAVYKLRSPNRTATINAPTLYASSGSYTTHARYPTTNQSLAAHTVQTRWVTYTADSTALSAGLRSVQGISPKQAGDYMELSEVIIYPGDYNPDMSWGWGDSPNWVWNGAPNASTSTGPAL